MTALTRTVLTASLAAASWYQAQQTPTFRGHVDLISLDVTVFDKAHRPVHGLTTNDFTLLEDDKPRPILAFSSVDIPDAAPPATPWVRDAPHDVIGNDVKARQLVLIVIDDAHFGPPWISDRARTIARAAIARLGPSDLAGVVFTGDNLHSQDFTTDHSLLLAAVNRTNETAMPPELAAEYAVDVIRRAADSLIGAAGNKKALIDITAFNMDMTPGPSIGFSPPIACTTCSATRRPMRRNSTPSRSR